MLACLTASGQFLTDAACLSAFKHKDSNGLLNSLAGYWNFDELSGDAIDSTGSYGNLINHGVFSVDGAPNGSSYCRYFPDGDVSYFLTPDNEAIHSAPLTFNIWVYMDESMTSAGPIFCKDDWSSGNRGICTFFGILSGGFLQFYNVDIDVGPVSNSDPTMSLFSTLKWYMLTMVITESYTYIYVNGEIWDSYPCNTDLSGSNSLSVGVRYFDSTGDFDGGWYFNGLMANFGIWNASLTGDQIMALYNSGAGLNFSQLTH